VTDTPDDTAKLEDALRDAGMGKREQPTVLARVELEAIQSRTIRAAIDDPTISTDVIIGRISDVVSFVLTQELTAILCSTRKLPKRFVQSSILRIRAEQRAAKLDTSAFGLDLAGLPWLLTDRGVYPTRRSEGGSIEPDLGRVVATRPIYPAASGTDIATKRHYVRVAWSGDNSHNGSAWLPEESLRDAAALRALDGAPVSLGRVNRLSDWLSDATPRAPEQNVKLTSRLGWINGQWTWRSAAGAVYRGEQYLAWCGPELPAVAGSLAEWRRGVDHLLTLGTAGYTALACVALSVASPLVRLTGRRCPIMGLVSETSTGKGSAITYALSAWGDPAKLTLPASSTTRGLQDLAYLSADLPVFVDEIQRLADRRYGVDIEDTLYYLGNGQRRVTSSRTQVSRGGERRWGVSYYASEGDVLVSGRHGGVLQRVLQLDGAPCPNAATAHLLQAASRSYGCLALAWHDYLALGPAVLPRDLVSAIDDPVGYLTACLASAETTARASWAALGGDDATSVALLWLGAAMLAGILGLPPEWSSPMIAWLCRRVAGARTSAADRASVAWEDLISMALSILPPTVSDESEAVLDHEPLAWRTAEHLDINPVHPRVTRLLAPYGALRSLETSWHVRGWIASQGRHLRVQRRVGAERVRVLRCKNGAPGLADIVPDDGA